MRLSNVDQRNHIFHSRVPWTRTAPRMYDCPVTRTWPTTSPRHKSISAVVIRGLFVWQESTLSRTYFSKIYYSTRPLRARRRRQRLEPSSPIMLEQNSSSSLGCGTGSSLTKSLFSMLARGSKCVWWWMTGLCGGVSLAHGLADGGRTVSWIYWSTLCAPSTNPIASQIDFHEHIIL